MYIIMENKENKRQETLFYVLCSNASWSTLVVIKPSGTEQRVAEQLVLLPVKVI